MQGAAAGVAGVKGAAAGGVQGAAAGSMHWARHRLQGRRHARRGRGHRWAEDIVNYINTKREAATMTMAFRWRLDMKNISLCHISLKDPLGKKFPVLIWTMGFT